MIACSMTGAGVLLAVAGFFAVPTSSPANDESAGSFESASEADAPGSHVGEDPAGHRHVVSPRPGIGEPHFGLNPAEHLTGDWGGARTWLSEQGIDFRASLLSVYQHNARGGLQTRNGHRVTGSADYELTLDLERMGLWSGGVLYTHAESGWGNDIAETRVGNLFGLNADAFGDEPIMVRQLWYEQSLFDEKIRVRAGKLDLALDLDTNAYANDENIQFLNPALVNTGNIPFPDFGLGLQVVVEPVDWLYLVAAVGDARADGRETGFRTMFHGADHLFAAFEVGLLPEWQTPWGNLPGGYRFGMWYDPQPKARFLRSSDDQRRFAAADKRDDVGFYFNMDQMLFRENPDDEDEQGLGFFLRCGWAPGDANEIYRFWSLGGQYQGLIPTRDGDVLGFGFAQGILSDRLRGSHGPGRESVYELYYSIQVFPWFLITPDFQWVVDPGGDGATPSAFVAGLRVQVVF